VTPLVVAAVLTAAVTHAGWNAIAHGIRDQLVAFALIGAADIACGAVIAAYAPLPAPAAWPYLIASVILHIGYQALLMRAFRLGDFGQVYPVARGTAPLVVTVLALVLVQEQPGPWQTAGVAVACAGLVGLAAWGLRRRDADADTARPTGPALLAAVGTGCAIAVYTVVDGIGVRASGTPLGYTGWLVALMGPVIPLYALAVRRRALWAQLRPVMAPVAALRESSIIAGAAIGAVVFRERFGGPRVVAAGLMVAGIALMLLGNP
jgi:drug/metabolite transporter (DMT)-like permease